MAPIEGKLSSGGVAAGRWPHTHAHKGSTNWTQGVICNNLNKKTRNWKGGEVEILGGVERR